MEAVAAARPRGRRWADVFERRGFFASLLISPAVIFIAALVGGPLALVQNGDTIRIDAAAGTINVILSDQELALRQAQWRPAALPPLGGTLEKYAAVVGPAHLGAVTHSGKVNWPG